MQNKTISNLLIILSFIATVLTYIFPQILIFGMNKGFIANGNYIFFIVQIILYQFLHGGILHVLSNSFFLYIFGNQLEYVIGKKRYIVFFLLNTIFVATSLLLLSVGNTVGISGFAMAILSYIFLTLKKNNHPDYKSAGVFLIINILIGIGSNISFVGHLSGAIFGLIFYKISRLQNKR